MYISPNQQSFHPNFQAYEKTFVIIKPDAVKRDIEGIILNKIKNADLEILDEWTGIASRKMIEGNHLNETV